MSSASASLGKASRPWPHQTSAAIAHVFSAMRFSSEAIVGHLPQESTRQRLAELRMILMPPIVEER
jgi:hypothetical protein